MGNASSGGEPYANSGSLKTVSLGFHPVCSENITVDSSSKRKAKRIESFCKGICFSNRPVKINEKIFVRIASLSTSWSGFLRVGFTSRNPADMDPSELPRYACPDLTNRPGYWAKALPERFSVLGNVLCYYVTTEGDVHLWFNQEDLGIFFNGVDTSHNLWALIDIYGNCTSVEFVDGMPTASHDMTTPTSFVRPSNVQAHWEISEVTPVKFYKQIGFIPLVFHAFCGSNVSLNAERTVATRRSAEYSNAYVFTARPLHPGERLLVQILSIDRSFAGSLTVGMTSCDPATLRKDQLPDDADALLDRSEYWVVHKDVYGSAECGDELTFALSSEGEVQFGKNGQHIAVIMHVDKTVPMWLFFDVYGQLCKMKLLGLTGSFKAHKDAPMSSLHPQPGLQTQHSLKSPQEVLTHTIIPSQVTDSSFQMHQSDGLRVDLPPASSSSSSTSVVQPLPSAWKPDSASVGYSQLTSELPPVPPRIARGTNNSGSRGHQSCGLVTSSCQLPSLAGAGISALVSVSKGAGDNQADDDGSRDNQHNECIVCFEKACDAVLYTCGHVCMCYECAVSVKSQSSPLCPICRQRIQDVIRMFRS